MPRLGSRVRVSFPAPDTPGNPARPRGFLFQQAHQAWLKHPVWPSGRVVMQRIANPWTSVRFRPRPPLFFDIKQTLTISYRLVTSFSSLGHHDSITLTDSDGLSEVSNGFDSQARIWQRSGANPSRRYPARDSFFLQEKRMPTHSSECMKRDAPAD